MTRPLSRSQPFDAVYRAHAATVYRYCLSQVGSPHDAEDLASEVFVSAFRDYERTRPDAVLPWLLRIARNAVIDHYRRRTRRGNVLTRFLGRWRVAEPTPPRHGARPAAVVAAGAAVALTLITASLSLSGTNEEVSPVPTSAAPSQAPATASAEVVGNRFRRQTTAVRWDGRAPDVWSDNGWEDNGSPVNP